MVSLNVLCSCQYPEQLSVTMRAEVSLFHGYEIDKRREQPCKRETSARRVTICLRCLPVSFLVNTSKRSFNSGSINY